MKIIDILLLLLILVGAYDGYKKGLLVELIALLGFIIAIISGLKLVHTGISYLSLKSDDKLIYFTVFLIIFIVVFVAIFMFGKFLKNILDYTLLGQFDNWIGALVGALKVAFGLSLLVWLMHFTKITLPNSYTADTYLFPYLINFAPTTVKWISFVIPFQDIFPLVQKSMNG